MLASTLAAVDPWRYQIHPEVWALVVFFSGAYVYVAKVIGPKAVPAGVTPVNRRHVTCFVLAMALFWFGADWPVHDVGEQYLYSVHMFQHMIFSYFVPPLALLATPEWMARLLLGEGRVKRAYVFATKPIVAGVVFNLMVMVLHIPALVNASTENGVLHYTLHLMVVLTALMMWSPVCGPLRELHLSPGGKCIYLFLMSVVPTVPAGWLTFAEGAVYHHYRQPVRVWGLSVTEDQQLAGAIMKIGGGFFLWTIVIYLYFKRFGAGFNEENTYVRSEQPLTFEQVSEAFDRSEPPLLEAEQGARD